MPPITLILPNDFPNLPVVLPVGDAAGHLLLTVVHQQTPGTNEVPYAAVYLVDRDWSSATLIGRDDLPAKTSAACARLKPGAPGRQTVELVVTEAGAAGGPGSSNVVHVYTFEDAVPAALPPVEQVCVDQPAREQALAATNIAKLALEKIKGFAAAIGVAAGQYD